MFAVTTPRTPTVSVVISTKNRKEELRETLASACAQTVRSEIIVLDDGSTDGTSRMVEDLFPTVILKRTEVSRGYIHQRNRGAEIATGSIIISIDDDAVFSSTTVIEQTLNDFADPRIGAVAIPFREPRKSDRLQQHAPDPNSTWITSSYIGTAHAIRADIFLGLGGYRELFVHQGEEDDLCLRMLEAGFFVRLGRSLPILHWESPKRDYERMDFYGPRNAILFHRLNSPVAFLLPGIANTAIRCFLLTFNPRRFRNRARGIFAGLTSSLKTNSRPVSTATYLRWRRLRSQKQLTLESSTL